MNDTGDNPYLIKVLIDYIYTKNVEITHENVEELLIISDKYCLESLCRLCEDYISDHIEIKNCLSLRSLALTYQRKLLLYLVDCFICHNFEELAKHSTEFVKMAEYELIDFLRSDELNAKDEHTVFEILLKWIDHNPKKRQSILGQALKSIRMGLMDSEYFMKKVKAHPWIKDRDELKPIIKGLFLVVQS